MYTKASDEQRSLPYIQNLFNSAWKKGCTKTQITKKQETIVYIFKS